MRLVEHDKYKKRPARSAEVFAVLVTLLLYSVLASGQKPEYDSDPEFRNSFTPKLRAENPSLSLTNEQIAERYAAELKSDGITETEIARRTRLYSDIPQPPGGRLLESVLPRQPFQFQQGSERFPQANGGRGAARNCFGLWNGRGPKRYLPGESGMAGVGFDPADAGVALAQKRAKELGLTLHTATVRDSEYDFGKERFDLVLFSWTMPLVPVQKVVDSRKPGGIVVMECGADFVSGRNEILHMFDPLQIVRYEIVRAKSDFYDRRETDVLRLVARKP